MWKTLAGCFLIASSIPFASAPAADATVAAAKQAVTAFAGDPKLAVPEPRPIGDGKYWRFDLRSAGEYWVEKARGRVTRAYYRRSHFDDIMHGRMSQQQAEALARKYTKEHFLSFLARNLKVQTYVYPDHADVDFHETVPENSADAGNMVTVNLDTRSAKVVSVLLIDEPLPAEARRQPRISRDEAARIALKSLNGQPGSVIKHEGLEWVRQPISKLAWGVVILPMLPHHPQGDFYVRLDAQTGKVIFTSRPK